MKGSHFGNCTYKALFVKERLKGWVTMQKGGDTVDRIQSIFSE